MKYKGKKLKGPNVEFIILPRPNEEEDIIFKAKAVLCMDDFDKYCPLPKMPQKLVRGKGMVDDPDDPHYKAQLDDRNKKRIDWLVIESIKDTEGLEWEKVKTNDPNTWHLYKEELREAGFNDFEINRIVNGVLIANSLDEKKMEEARERFLHTQLAQGQSSSPLVVQQNTLNGEHAKGSKSDLPA